MALKHRCHDGTPPPFSHTYICPTGEHVGGWQHPGGVHRMCFECGPVYDNPRLSTTYIEALLQDPGPPPPGYGSFEESFVDVETVQHFVVGSTGPHFLHPSIYELSHIEGLAEVSSELIFYEVSITMSVPKSLIELLEVASG